MFFKSKVKIKFNKDGSGQFDGWPFNWATRDAVEALAGHGQPLDSANGKTFKIDEDDALLFEVSGGVLRWG